MQSVPPLELPSAALVRRSSADEAALYIRRLIFDGELRAGQRVPQDEIARALGISRIPVREALIALEREGWVTNERHRGTFVDAVSERALRDNFQIYATIYTFSANLALERGGPDLLDALDALADDVEQTTDPEVVNQLSYKFRLAILHAADSPRIQVLLRAMSGMVPGNFFAQVPGAIEVEQEGMRAIAEAMRSGDALRVHDVYSRKFAQQAEQCVQLFRDRDLFAAEPATD
jgi:DNA-binding GntR family transcriptional regulator